MKVNKTQLQSLRREYELLFMNDGEKIHTYLARTRTIVNKMKVNGDSLASGTIVAKVLYSISSKFNYVVCSIEEPNNFDTFTVDELHGGLLIREQQINMSYWLALSQAIKEDEVDAIAVEVEDVEDSGSTKSQLNAISPTNYGTFKVDVQNGRKMQNNYVDHDDIEKTILMAQVEKKNVTKIQVRFLDSGCLNHTMKEGY
ncbi:hypothetical protein OSB04_002396 [Centaurea solstitialis]|uniref:Uncharacterized protein n=1 Tax=Centaurea solstitialis TaxID=347529 RepID=A0AA38TSX8_9ASTR|nr:hypothetical protein OSB04_002396 [Centaurea solstitialis]